LDIVFDGLLSERKEKPAVMVSCFNKGTVKLFDDIRDIVSDIDEEMSRARLVCFKAGGKTRMTSILQVVIKGTLYVINGVGSTGNGSTAFANNPSSCIYKPKVNKAITTKENDDKFLRLLEQDLGNVAKHSLISSRDVKRLMMVAENDIASRDD
jgi:hypothetical protein